MIEKFFFAPSPCEAAISTACRQACEACFARGGRKKRFKKNVFEIFNHIHIFYGKCIFVSLSARVRETGKPVSKVFQKKRKIFCIL